MAAQASLLEAVTIVLKTQYSTFAMLTFVIYDWLINLDEEIRYFRNFRKGPRQTFAALLYGLSRYLTIIVQVLEVQTVFHLSDMACKFNFYAQIALNIPLTLTPAIFSAIRVYALSQNNKTMAISTFTLLAGLGLVIIVLNGVGGNPVVLPNPFNCSAVQTAINQEVSDGLNVASTVCAIAGDLLALLVTWRKTYTTYKAERGLLRGPSLIRLMLYNGSIYFLDITTINILNLVLYQTSSGVANHASIVTTPLSIVLTCHFLLNLRRADRTANAPPSLMSVPSLNLDAASVRDIQSGGPRSLPAFVASMGSEVHTGLDFVDSIARDQEWANEERSRVAEDLPHAYGDGGR